MILFISPSVKTVTKLERITLYRAFIASTKSEFRCLTSCIQQLMTKAGVRFGMKAV